MSGGGPQAVSYANKNPTTALHHEPGNKSEDSNRNSDGAIRMTEAAPCTEAPFFGIHHHQGWIAARATYRPIKVWKDAVL